MLPTATRPFLSTEQAETFKDSLKRTHKEHKEHAHISSANIDYQSHSEFRFALTLYTSLRAHNSDKLAMMHQNKKAYVKETKRLRETNFDAERAVVSSCRAVTRSFVSR
jgi:hypothetical protein